MNHTALSATHMVDLSLRDLGGGEMVKVRLQGTKEDMEWLVKRDLDACILQAGDYQQFFDLLSDKGYAIKQGKYLSVKPPGMTRYRRCKTLGDAYSEEAIRERIAKEDLSFYSKQITPQEAVLVRCRVKRYRRAKLSGVQKKYYAKLYRIGKLKKRPYSQVWKYRDDIRKMQRLQNEYLFLNRHDIHSVEQLVAVISSLTDKRKESSAEKSRIYKARERSRELFEIADEMAELEPAENSYSRGDTFFKEEHDRWLELEASLKAQGYSLSEVEELRKHYKEEYSNACAKERAVFKELKTGQSIWDELIPDTVSDGKDEDYNKEIMTMSRIWYWLSKMIHEDKQCNKCCLVREYYGECSGGFGMKKIKQLYF